MRESLMVLFNGYAKGENLDYLVPVQIQGELSMVDGDNVFVLWDVIKIDGTRIETIFEYLLPEEKYYLNDEIVIDSARKVAIVDDEIIFTGWLNIFINYYDMTLIEMAYALFSVMENFDFPIVRTIKKDFGKDNLIKAKDLIMEYIKYHLGFNTLNELNRRVFGNFVIEVPDSDDKDGEGAPLFIDPSSLEYDFDNYSVSFKGTYKQKPVTGIVYFDPLNPSEWNHYEFDYCE